MSNESDLCSDAFDAVDPGADRGSRGGSRRRDSGCRALDEEQGPVLAAHATEPLPPGAVSPGVASSNIIDRAVVTEAVRAVLGRLPRRTSRVGLVIPDGAAKVSLLPFETVPGRVADLDELIRWRMRKAVPFRVEDAQLAHTPGTTLPGGGREFIVVMMRRDIVEEYEAVCVDAGVQPGLVDLTSFNLINATLVDSSAAGPPRLGPAACGGRVPHARHHPWSRLDLFQKPGRR